MTIEYQFTRHLLSCNNIDEGKSVNFKKDFEPGATIFGILKTIEYAEKNKDKFISNQVYVSNLYRTWITAFLLYGCNLPQSSNNILTLYISPYLKESSSAFFRPRIFLSVEGSGKMV